MKLDELQEIKLYKTATKLIAYDGNRYYEVTPCKYVSTDKTQFPKDGFAFKPIEAEE